MNDARRAQIEAMQDAAQQWWDEFCIDTGDHPDFIWRENHNGHALTCAGFTQADAYPFFDAILSAAARVFPQPQEGERGNH